MIGVGFCISVSRLISQRNGLPSNFGKHFPGTVLLAICCGIGDRIFGRDFREQVKAMGIEEVLSAPRSPWQRAYVERVIGSIRRECLDHVIVLSEASLRRILVSYFA